MANKAYDVVVIGCGTAGAAAGRAAALGGARTLIVEKKRSIGLPEHDYCSILAYSWAEAENLANFKLDFSCAFAKADEIAYFTSTGKRGKGLPVKDLYWIHRSQFERFLATEAVHAGAKTMINSTVVDLVKEKGRVKGVVVKSGHETMTIECPVVIGASGTYANVALMAGLPPEQRPLAVGLAYEFVGVKTLQRGARTYEIYTGTHPSGSAGWARGGVVNPHTDDKVIVGVAYPLGVRAKTRRASELLNALIKHLEKIGKYNFDEAAPISLIAGCASFGQYQEKPPKIVSDGIMLVGDAAGKPLIGAQWGAPGMTNCLFTGRMAGEAASAAIKAGDVSEKRLAREYVDRIAETSAAERPRFMEAMKVVEKLGTLSSDKADKAIMEIGEELVALRIYEKGGLSFSWCMKPIQDWLRKEGV